MQLQAADTEDEIKTLQEGADWRYTVDGLPTHWSIKTRDTVLELTALQFGLLVICPFADKVKEGLQKYKVSLDYTAYNEG